MHLQILARIRCCLEFLENLHFKIFATACQGIGWACHFVAGILKHLELRRLTACADLRWRAHHQDEPHHLSLPTLCICYTGSVSRAMHWQPDSLIFGWSAMTHPLTRRSGAGITCDVQAVTSQTFPTVTSVTSQTTALFPIHLKRPDSTIPYLNHLKQPILTLNLRGPLIARSFLL